MPTVTTLGAASARGFGLFSSSSLTTADPYFNYNTLLLPGNGTNGAQNNTFLDSSTNNFTITRNGNTTQGTFTPYGSNWSNYFENTGSNNANYFSRSISGALSTTLTSSTQTREFWINRTVPSSTSFAPIIRILNGDQGTIYFAGGELRIYNSAVIIAVNMDTYVPIGVWTHIAMTQSGGTVTLWINGVSRGTSASTISSTGTDITIAGASDGLSVGYVSNLRLSNNARYSSAFTPSTTPFANDANTTLLICQSNRFVDNSSNAFTFTNVGSPSVQRFSPFSPSAAYAAGTIGGSGYFDGNGDYLDLGNQTALHIGSGDFTVEMWIWKNANTTYMTACGDFLSASTNTFQIIADVGGTKIGWYDGASNSYTITSTATISVSVWTHIAFVRSGSTLTLYINGVSDSTATLSTNYNASTSFFIGHTPELSAGRYWNGYISDLRVVKGTAVYTSAFTPPSAPLTAITNTSLLTNFTNGGIIDNAMMNDLETVGNAQISTTQSKFGGSSMYFDGTGDYLFLPSNQNFVMGSGNFTVEGWVYFNSSSSNQEVFGLNFNTNQSSYASARLVGNSGTWQILASTTGSSWDFNSAVGAYSANTWYHFAYVRNSSTIYLYINGVQINSASISGSLYAGTYGSLIGDVYWSGGHYYLNGYIDDLRITKGVARYTAAFTPPSAAFPLS